MHQKENPLPSVFHLLYTLLEKIQTYLLKPLLGSVLDEEKDVLKLVVVAVLYLFWPLAKDGKLGHVTSTHFQ